MTIPPGAGVAGEIPRRGAKPPPSGGGSRARALTQSTHMSDRRIPGTLQERPRRRLTLADGIGEVLGAVSRSGFALVRAAVPASDRHRLLAEADAAAGRFLRVPSRVNRVEQQADQLTLRVGDERFPAVNALATALQALLTSCADTYGVHRFAATEGRYMRYRGRRGGLGPHRDGMCYGLVVAVYSLTGSAPFTVLPDEADADEAPLRLLVDPGDLLLLRAPGFDGEADGRRLHAVGAPLSGDRVSLTLRMVGRHGSSAPDRWSRAG